MCQRTQVERNVVYTRTWFPHQSSLVKRSYTQRSYTHVRKSRRMLCTHEPDCHTRLPHQSYLVKMSHTHVHKARRMLCTHDPDCHTSNPLYCHTSSFPVCALNVADAPVAEISDSSYWSSSPASRRSPEQLQRCKSKICAHAKELRSCHLAI